ncbi:porin family protein [Burkholderia alba]|uniref:hypothetical protein n=1 Tax=Burkholderia alba TaxID=2683677 RepID=UPI002B05601F|nr:hypothetical protein [Burkholderia alba]
MSYMITPALQLGSAYSYRLGNVSATGQKPHYHEFDASVDHLLSRHTDLYETAVYICAGSGAVANLAPVITTSSSQNQVALRVGIRSASDRPSASSHIQAVLHIHIPAATLAK